MQTASPAASAAETGNPRGWRWPAEWEPQDAVLLAWPHAGTDWAARLDEVEVSWVALVSAIARYQAALVCVPDAGVQARARGQLAAAGVDGSRVRWVTVDYDDTWLRDTGPITLLDRDRVPRFLDFRFTGWGGKFDAGADDALVASLAARRILPPAAVQSVDFELEGGAVETDGAGTLLTTWHCLHRRHPQLSRDALEQRLRRALFQDRVLWLEHGELEGDDTDAHIDTLARFAPDNTIVYQACDDPGDPHHGPLGTMARELAAFRTASGEPYRLLPLPWPAPVLDEGRRLPASYANFLVINGAVLVPAYGDPADPVAAEVLAAAFPGRAIIPVPCRSLIWQNGSLHCLTMQIPQGALRHA